MNREAPTPPTEVIFDNGSSYFDALINDIEQAEQDILLESYIYEEDI